MIIDDLLKRIICTLQCFIAMEIHRELVFALEMILKKFKNFTGNSGFAHVY